MRDSGTGGWGLGWARAVCGQCPQNPVLMLFLSGIESGGKVEALWVETKENFQMGTLRPEERGLTFPPTPCSWPGRS